MELKRVLKNQAYRSILKFFNENPNSVDTPRGVATWTNQEIGKVRASLKKLSQLGLLIAHDSPSTTAYSYTEDAKTISKINKLLKE